MAERPVPEALTQLDRYRSEIVRLLGVGDGGLGQNVARQPWPAPATIAAAALAA